MRNPSRRPTLGSLASSGLVAFGLALPAEAHGAVFPPPPPEPGGGGGGVPGLPAQPVPPSAGPAPSPPSTPRPAPPATTTGTPAPDTTAPSPNTPGNDGVVDLTTWTWWWELNKEPFLDLKAHLWSGAVTTGSDGFFLGQGYRRQRHEQSLRPPASLVRSKVIPGLVAALRQAPSSDVVTACLVALAKVGEDLPEENRLEIAQLLRPHLAAANQEVAETATIALGILGEDGSAMLLGEILLDTRTGQDAVGRGEVPLRTRAFAAYALGLLGHQLQSEDLRRFVVHRLVRALETDDTATPDLGAACVLALGHVPLAWTGVIPEERTHAELPASASRESQVLYLLALLDQHGQRGQRELHRLVSAQVPTALGYLLEPSGDGSDDARGATLRRRVVESLLARLGDRRREAIREVRQSIVLSLGRLGDRDDDPLDARVRAALLDPDVAGGDVLTGHFACIAAAQAAARAGGGSSAGLEEVRAHLQRLLTRGQSEKRSWAALGLAILERRRTEQGQVPDREALAAMRFSLEESVAPLEVGALSIACGLVGDQDSAPPLLAKLGTVRQEQARGHVAVGLGLLPAQEALNAIRALVEESTYKPLLLRESAIALGLLQDRRTTAFLAERLATASSLVAQASLAQALGRIGDVASIDPLLAMLGDAKLTDGARAFAAVALGIIADQDELPWNAVLSVDVNYAAAPATLFDHAGYGVLNLL